MERAQYILDVVEKPFDVRELNVKHFTNYIELSQNLNEDLRERWRKLNSELEEKFTFNANCIRFKDFKKEKETRIISVDNMKYTNYRTMRDICRESFDQVLANNFRPYNTTIFVESKDGEIVLGYRSESTSDPNVYALIGGFSKHSEKEIMNSNKLRRVIIEQLTTELGESLLDKEQQNVDYLGSTLDNTTIFDSDYVVRVLLEKSSKEIEEEWKKAEDKGEHEHLIYLKRDEKTIEDFMLQKLNLVVNPFSGIKYENGKLVEGPEELRKANQTITQFEYEKSIFLLYGKLLFGNKWFESTTKEMQKRKILGELLIK